jgi:DNA-binding transcriptional LysR family regulator
MTWPTASDARQRACLYSRLVETAQEPQDCSGLAREELVKPLRQALELLRAATKTQVVFDPVISRRHFKVSMTDVSHLEFLPALINRLNKLAPSIHVEVLRISAQTPRPLESGDSDLAVGYMPELEAGFYQQKLFEQGLACVVRKRHPRIAARMTTALYKREKHVAITAVGTGHDLVEAQLERRGIQRQVALSLPTLRGPRSLVPRRASAPARASDRRGAQKRCRTPASYPREVPPAAIPAGPSLIT